MLPRWLPPLLLTALAGAPPGTGDDPALRLPEITVEVLEQAWRVGDEKTYTLAFDRAPFGRQAMRLIALRDLPDGDREAVFRQRIRLDLRALGQPGSLEHAGTIVYRRDGPGIYRYQETLLADHGYGTYRTPDDYRASLEVEVDPSRGSFRAAEDLARAEPRPLPEPANGLLIDLLALGQWEHVFTGRRRWPLGSRWEIPLLVPTGPPRFDFHRPVQGPREVSPERLPATMTVETVEEIELFGARVEAFRCRVDPPGITLWVSPNGGILRFADGRGLTGSLEP